MTFDKSCLGRSNLFFILFEKKFFRFEACMEIIKKLKCIPMNADEVQAFVSTFYMVSDQVGIFYFTTFLFRFEEVTEFFNIDIIEVVRESFFLLF